MCVHEFGLYSHIKNDGKLSWNKKGEIGHVGEVVPGTHITDLFKDSQYKYKHFNPAGYGVFYKALKEMTIPRGLIGHWQRMELLGQKPQEILVAP